MKKFFASLLSIILRRPVYTGMGTTADPTFKFSKKTVQRQAGRFHSEGVVKHMTYVAKDKETIGEFRLVNLSRKLPGKVHYQLKHMPTGKVYNLPKDLLELLFERK